MKSALVAEASPTRRRALASLLGQRGWDVIAPTSPQACCDVLAHAAHRGLQIEAVVVGWPERLERPDHDLLELLHAEHLQHVPVVVFADVGTDTIAQWRMARPRTSLLMWSEYTQVARQIEQASVQQILPTPPLPRPQSAQRVLLVDDSPTVRTAFKRLMQKHGYEVEIAESAESGLKLALARPFDIAIVDYFMPGQNGTALIAALRRYPQTRHILAAIITGTYSDEVIVESLASGAVECLFKSETKDLFVARLASLARTVHDRKAIDAERRRLEGILAAVGDGVFGVEADGTILFVNPAAVQILGYQDARFLIGRSAGEAIHPGPNGEWNPEVPGELSLAYRNGEILTQWQSVFWTASRLPIPVEGTVYPLHVDGTRRGSVVAFRDVSAQRKLEEQLRWQAEHDSLTQLHNRAWFERQLDLELQRLRQQNDAGALLFVDLDRFKYINDTAGHSAGDELLIEVSKRIRSQLRPGDQIARMGGDEYAILLRNVPAEDIGTLADSIRTAISNAPFIHGGKAYRITLSIGATAIDHLTPSPEAAMAQADLACYQSKNAGRARCHVYNPEQDALATMTEELGWSSRLQDALVQDRFELVYQPIVPLRGIENETGEQPPTDLWQRQFLRNPDEPMIFEALLRLRGNEGDLIPPSVFLPSAERFGLMADIDRWVIARAIRALQDTRDYHRPVSLTLNLSAESLADDSLVDFVTDCLVRHDVDPGALIFEITESRTLEDIVGVRALLTRLRLLGCHIAIDDFGTGFSTFAYLRQLDADFLKIDGSIVQGLPNDALDRTVIAALASIAEITGKRTVAEWAESIETLHVLHECGVDFAQGFAIGHPRLQLLPSASRHLRTSTARIAPQASAHTSDNVTRLDVASRR
ncbi:EAL domain-containing protein [Xanthomonadaceae bacterium JHOS43]|nr:EAL domain-containing protein [Xanthomonadaceae bacterium JHOS43]